MALTLSIAEEFSSSTWSLHAAMNLPKPVESQLDQSSSSPVMSRPRPGTRRFHLDRRDVDQLCGARVANRLRRKIPLSIIAAERQGEDGSKEKGKGEKREVDGEKA